MKTLFLLIISSFITISAMAQSAYHGSVGDGYSSFTSNIVIKNDAVISSQTEIFLKAISLNKGEELPSEIKKIQSICTMQGQNLTVSSSKQFSDLFASGIYQVQYIDDIGNYRKVIIRLI
jgi:hypothetical protein